MLPDCSERLVLAYPFENDSGDLMRAMLVSSKLTYLSQVATTLSYSTKLAALGRTAAGTALQVKNPLNATMIRLELLKMNLGAVPGALDHVSLIATQVRRLDDVVKGFLKFTRAEDLKLQRVHVADLIDEILPIVDVE